MSLALEEEKKRLFMLEEEELRVKIKKIKFFFLIFTKILLLIYKVFKFFNF